MNNTMEFTDVWKASDGTTFLRGWIFCIDKILAKTVTQYYDQPGCPPCASELRDHFQITYNETTYDVPDLFAARSNKPVPAKNVSIEQAHVIKATKDAYEKDGMFDLVGATADFFGHDIRPKPFGDQADYETPLWLINQLAQVEPRLTPQLGIVTGSVGAGEGPAPATDETPDDTV